ncbi:putative hydrolase [Yersinia aleksiciae]|nr:putative hydrolase [Yersinia aleksiciae]
MNAGLFVRTFALSAILAATTVQASSVTHQKEAITENNLPVFYPQLKK